MLWVNKDLDAEQVPVLSSNAVSATVRLPGREILLLPIYVQGNDAEALLETYLTSERMICKARRAGGHVVDVIIAGGFNRHDCL